MTQTIFITGGNGFIGSRVARQLINQGYGEFITQRAELDETHLDSAFWFNAILGVSLTTIIAAGAKPIADMLDEPSGAWVVRWLSLSLVLRSISIVPSALLVRRMQFRSLSLRGLLASAIGGVVGIVAAVQGMGVMSLVLQVLVADCAAVAILWRAAKWRPGFRVTRQSLRELSTFGAPIFVATLLNFGSRRLDTAIIAQFRAAHLDPFQMASIRQ